MSASATQSGHNKLITVSTLMGEWQRGQHVKFKAKAISLRGQDRKFFLEQFSISRQSLIELSL